MEILGRHYFISGRVQGVFYRHSTRQKALELKLTGWVKNNADGRVECAAFGTLQQLDTFEQWLWQGPSIANVTGVDTSDIAPESLKGFDIL